MITVIANLKGGSGKSTVTFNLALWLQMSTVTFSSTAGLAPGGMQSTPLLNLPNALLIGPSTPQDKPVVHKGKIKVRTMLPVSITFDHRVLDGSPIAKLAKIMHDCLENPELMLL